MRDITYKSVRAFMDKVPFKLGNTTVDILEDFTGKSAILTLHGNAIAVHTKSNRIEVTSAGWETSTTKERLNGIPNVSVVQKAGQWYLNGQKWEKSDIWTKVQISCPVCEKPFVNGTCAECDKLVASL